MQLQTLALGVDEFLSEITTRFPDISEASGEFDEPVMQIFPPVDPLFRVGELALAYDSDSDLAILIAKEVTTSEQSEEEQEEDNSVVRFWCTRSQLLAMCRWGLEVSGRGRPVCPYCGQPMDPAGHFCPKRNGHRH